MLSATHTVTLELPIEIEEKEAQQMILSILFGKGIISSGKAAEILNIPRVDFLTKLGEYGISAFSDDDSSLEATLNNSYL
ncbi:MAG: UPF0175 family protein [Bacteroidota bacterium]